MPRLTSAASIPVLLWAMPKYERPPAPPLIQAVARADVAVPTFKGHMLSATDRAYLMEHGMPNGASFRIDDSPPPEGFTGITVTPNG